MERNLSGAPFVAVACCVASLVAQPALGHEQSDIGSADKVVLEKAHASPSGTGR